jgi:hypothetical protein
MVWGLMVNEIDYVMMVMKTFYHFSVLTEDILFLRI